jgi:hypothetical protein
MVQSIDFQPYAVVLKEKYGEIIVKGKISDPWKKFFTSHMEKLQPLLKRSNLTYDKLYQNIMMILEKSPRCAPELLIFCYENFKLELSQESLYANFEIKNNFQIQASMIMYITIIDRFSSFFPKLYITVEESLRNSSKIPDIKINFTDKVKIIIEFNEESHKKSKDFEKMKDIYEATGIKVLQFYEYETDIDKFIRYMCDHIIVQLNDTLAKRFYLQFYDDKDFYNIDIIKAVYNSFGEYSDDEYKKEIQSISGRNIIRYIKAKSTSDSENSNYDPYDSSSDFEP